MIRITWFGKSTPYSAKIAHMAFLLAFIHLDYYIFLDLLFGWTGITTDTFISIASFMLLGILFIASKAERRMFLPKDFKFAGILAQGYWLILLVFHAVVCIKPDLYLKILPNLLGYQWQSFLLYVPVVLFGILELKLGNKYFRKEDWESDVDQPVDQADANKEPSA